ncbi:MAG: hypothetical protein K2I18_06895 [Paramuribaculum sp.]|nr:hypothetical protein [Paramuribaculum sp.]
MKLHHIILSALTAAALLSGCASEKFDAPEPAPEGAVTITARCTDMLPQVLMSRAFGNENFEPKEAEEKRINRLHLFFFDSDGNFLQPNPDADVPWQPYHVVDLGYSQLAAVSVPKDAFVGQTALKGVQIFAVANAICDDPGCDHKECKFRVADITDDGKICHGDASDPTKEITITHLSDLMNWYYRPQERKDDEITKLPAGGMPMVVLYKSGADEAILAQDGKIDLDMRALMARVDVQVRLDANQTSHDHQLPTLRVTEYGIKNMPICVPFTEVGANDTTLIGKGADLRAEKTIKVSDRTLIDGQEAMLFTYYTYENVRKATGEADYPDAIVENDKNGDLKQRWKPTIAQKETASAFVMKGRYITHQGLKYDAQFTVYLGNNTVDNFEVRRNHCYKNRISIRGLDYVRNDDPTVYTFDGRVNVRTDNPVYISIVNERKIDAHATALPMDIYFMRMEEGSATCLSTVDIEILADELTGQMPGWLRMEKVPAINMTTEPAGLDNTTYIYDRGVLTAGRGARRYFTHDLVTNTLAANTSVSVGNNFEGSDPEGGTRTRIYFYIDENVPESNNPANYGDRTARVRIHYHNDEGEDRDRILEIDQKALLRVRGTISGETIDGWMEYYEEYLDHKDPLDKHDMPAELYSGLPWGLDNTSTSGFKGSTESYEVYSNGQAMSSWVIGASSVPMSSVQMFNTEKPETAFHYAMGKNKRNADGSIYESKWYLPGIRELEVGLINYWNTFPEFQDILYWSASAGKEVRETALGPTGQREDEDRARATRIDAAGENVNSQTHHYVVWNNKVTYDPGSRPRTEPNRIRAFYKVQ